MPKDYLQEKIKSKGMSTMEGNVFITFSLEKHHLDTKQARKLNPNL
jgi:hypothetical protein